MSDVRVLHFSLLCYACRIDIDAELAKIDDEEEEPKSEKQVKNVLRKSKKPQIPHTVDTTGKSCTFYSNMWPSRDQWRFLCF